jgi:hypothetical protein
VRGFGQADAGQRAGGRAEAELLRAVVVGERHGAILALRQARREASLRVRAHHRRELLRVAALLENVDACVLQWRAVTVLHDALREGQLVGAVQQAVALGADGLRLACADGERPARGDAVVWLRACACQQCEQVDVLYLLHGGEPLLQREQPVAQRVVDRRGEGDSPAQGLNHRQYVRACAAGLRGFGVAERRHIHLHAVILYPRQQQCVGLRAVARVLQARFHKQGRRVGFQRVGEGHLHAYRLGGHARGLVNQRQAFVDQAHAQDGRLARAARRDDFECRRAQCARGKQPPRVGNPKKLLAEKVAAGVRLRGARRLSACRRNARSRASGGRLQSRRSLCGCAAHSRRVVHPLSARRVGHARLLAPVRRRLQGAQAVAWSFPIRYTPAARSAASPARPVAPTLVSLESPPRI